MANTSSVAKNFDAKNDIFFSEQTALLSLNDVSEWVSGCCCAGVLWLIKKSENDSAAPIMTCKILGTVWWSMGYFSLCFSNLKMSLSYWLRVLKDCGSRKYFLWNMSVEISCFIEPEKKCNLRFLAFELIVYSTTHEHIFFSISSPLCDYSSYLCLISQLIFRNVKKLIIFLRGPKGKSIIFNTHFDR